MKRIGFLAMIALMVGICLSSCQERREKLDDAIASKIESKEALTSEDYARMIQYVGEYAQKAQKYLDMQINDTDNAEAKEGLAKLSEEYPLVDTFRNCISQTPVGSFTPENLEMIQNYAGYIEFTAPDGFTLQTNPEAAGMEVEAPLDTTPNPDEIVAGLQEEKVQEKW